MKRGSALLVVLGMLAFMLISAVSFSAYMRYARLPSSFLRRSSASRMLAKAALAEAIDEIDAAIGNNPHPGVGTRQPRPGAGSLNADKNGLQSENLLSRNTWMHRVYIGTNAVNDADLENKLVDPDETVSTLTLEGLAYIPPSIVNEARYYSRRSRAGIWKGLGFDAGRYAFCAIDVSDLLDVNRLSAKVPRNSSPEGRIALAHLFENDTHTGTGQDPKQWDDFLENSVKVRQMSSAEAVVKNPIDPVFPTADAQHVPFISVADLNLAINDQKPAGWESPFCRYLDSGGDFYNGAGVTDPTGGNAEKVKRMSFVTDSLFPAQVTALATRTSDLCDISNPDEQPFMHADLTMDAFPVDRIVGDNPTRESARRIANKTSFFGLAALYDYLDANNVPLSLAMPTTERAPMICGIGNTNMKGAKLKVTSSTTPDVPEAPSGTSRWISRTTIYKIDGAEFSKFIDDGTFKAVLAYPFRRGVDLLNNPAQAFKYTLEGQLTVFFAREGAIGFRTGGGLLRPTENLFTDAGKMDGGVLRIPLKFESFKNTLFNVDDVIQNDGDAVRDADAILSMSGEAKTAIMEYLEANPLLTVVERWQQSRSVDALGVETWSPQDPPAGSEASADSSLAVLKSGGAAEPFESFIGGREEKLVVGSALWLRVKNGNDKTVDLVPACPENDRALNNVNADGILADMVGRDPVLLTTANAGNPLVLSCAALKTAAGSGGTPIDLDFTMNIQCIDPRWNWAPEHWYAIQGGDVTKDTWLTAVRGFVDKDERDHDIFLATSDAGYLQSVYELAFLPRFTDLENYGNNQVCGNMELLNGTFNAFVTDPEQVKNRHLMWKSYHPYATDTGAPRDPFEDLRIVSDGGGFRINPYTKDLDVLKAAFANTPADWWAASAMTEEMGNASGKMQYPRRSERLDAQQFNRLYAFNEYNSDAKFTWQDVSKVAEKFRDHVQARVKKVFDIGKVGEKVDDMWMDVFDGTAYKVRPTGLATDPVTMVEDSGSLQPQDREYLDWDGMVEGDFCEVAFSGTDRLYDVDRKFLYGFWRECFAARQQLFLIFVRAEPAMMGGGAAGATPPQLGARAVALVWRDPTISKSDQTPHRTRVLFYRQFD